MDYCKRFYELMKTFVEEVNMPDVEKANFWRYLNRNVFMGRDPKSWKSHFSRNQYYGPGLRNRVKNHIIKEVSKYFIIPEALQNIRTTTAEDLVDDIDRVLNRCILTKRLYRLMNRILNDALIKEKDKEEFKNYLKLYVFSNFEESTCELYDIFCENEPKGYRCTSYSDLLIKLEDLLTDNFYLLDDYEENAISCSNLRDFIDDLENKLFDICIFPKEKTPRSKKAQQQRYQQCISNWKKSVEADRKTVEGNLDIILGKLLDKALSNRTYNQNQDQIKYEFSLPLRVGNNELWDVIDKRDKHCDTMPESTWVDPMDNTLECAYIFKEKLEQNKIGSVTIKDEYNIIVRINSDIWTIYNYWLQNTQTDKKTKERISEYIKKYYQGRQSEESTKSLDDWIANLIVLKLLRKFGDLCSTHEAFKKDKSIIDVDKSPLLDEDTHLDIFYMMYYLIDLANTDDDLIRFSADEVPREDINKIGDYYKNTIYPKVLEKLRSLDTSICEVGYDCGDTIKIRPGVSLNKLSLYMEALEETQDLISLRNNIGPDRCIDILSTIIKSSFSGVLSYNMDKGIGDAEIDLPTVINEAQKDKFPDINATLSLENVTLSEKEYIELLVSRLYSFDCSIESCDEKDSIYTLKLKLNIKYFARSLKGEYEALVFLQKAWEERRQEVEMQLIMNPNTRRNQTPGKITPINS